MAKAIIYLGALLPTPSSGTSRFWRDTTLHSSKDLAVSPPALPPGLAPSNDGAAVAFASGRLCSHLADCSGRALPATLLPVRLSQSFGEHSILQLPAAGKIGECSDFPLCNLFAKITKQLPGA